MGYMFWHVASITGGTPNEGLVDVFSSLVNGYMFRHVASITGGSPNEGLIDVLSSLVKGYRFCTNQPQPLLLNPKR